MTKTEHSVTARSSQKHDDNRGEMTSKSADCKINFNKFAFKKLEVGQVL